MTPERTRAPTRSNRRTPPAERWPQLNRSIATRAELPAPTGAPAPAPADHRPPLPTSLRGPPALEVRRPGRRTAAHIRPIVLTRARPPSAQYMSFAHRRTRRSRLRTLRSFPPPTNHRQRAWTGHFQPRFWPSCSSIDDRALHPATPRSHPSSASLVPTPVTQFPDIPPREQCPKMLNETGRQHKKSFWTSSAPQFRPLNQVQSRQGVILQGRTPGHC
jgi:hypothetical protein